MRAVRGSVDEEADALKCCVNANSASFVTRLKHKGKEVPLALNVALATSIKCHHQGRELPQLGTVLLVSEKRNKRGRVSLVAQLVKNPPATWETWIRSLSQEDPLEKVQSPFVKKLTCQEDEQTTREGFQVFLIKSS